MKEPIVIFVILVMASAIIPVDTAAKWVEPVPGSTTDDAYWDVTYDFEDYWKENFDAYEPGNSNREPDIIEYDGKLWILWEGLLVPNNPQEPVAYKGKMYLRSYDDQGSEPQWGDIIGVTPNAYYSDHANQKGRMAVFEDKLYIVWQSNDRNQKPQSWEPFQFDIMMRTYDGNKMNELSPPEIISDVGTPGVNEYNQFPYPIVFNDKLYVIWFWEDIENGYSNILYRAFDGTSWGDINVLSEYPNNDTDNLWPTCAVYEDQLFVMWQRAVAGSKITEVVYSYTDDGNTWSAVGALSRPIDRSAVSMDTLNDMGIFHNPKTQKPELHVFWRTYNTENTPGSIYDYDIVSRVWDGDNWSPTREISPAYDRWDDTEPDVVEMGGKLHIFWASKDQSVTDGKDYDIVHITYDGASYSNPEVISRIGDRDKPLFDDSEWWNEGDDLWPRATVTHNKWGEERLFVSWWTFDYITGCCYNDVNGSHSSIVVRLLEDADHDKDGITDHKDACDEDPDGWRVDTDRDGYCDASDWKPNDPTSHGPPISSTNERPDGDPLPMYILILVLFVVAVALMASSGGKKRPRPIKEHPGDEEE